MWSPADSTNCLTEFKSLDGLRQLHPEFETHSQYLNNYYGSVFKSPELGRFELLREFPGSGSADSLPAEIRQVLGRPEQNEGTPGAYPLQP